ncbi:7-carboxy-7-deazaguanine synthase QueE, partial [Bacillus atrophaeus]
GNPALLKQLDTFITLLKEQNIRTALETQGTVYQEWFTLIDDLTISPKPPSSGMTTDFKKLDHILTSLKDENRLRAVSLKVVIFNDRDLEYAKTVHKRYPDIPLYLQVGNDNVHTTDDQSLITHLLGKYETLVDKVAADAELNLVRVLPQLHTLLWGNKRGV